MNTLNNLRRGGLWLAALLPLCLVFQDRETDGFDWRLGTKKDRLMTSALLQDMQGTWQLKRLEMNDQKVGQTAGFMLVSGTHLSLEIHGDFTPVHSYVPNEIGSNRRPSDQEGVTRTGVYSFRLGGFGRMTMRSLIGIVVTPDDAYEFVPPGEVRRFHAVMDGRQLELRSEKRVYVFVRVAGSGVERDFYGRVRSARSDDAEEEEEDVEVERDIYGRIKKKRPPPGEEKED